MDAEKAVVIARSEARARDATLFNLRQLVRRYPIEARDAGRRLDVKIRRLMNEAHAIKQLAIRTNCQMLEVARVLAIEFLETEGPPGYLRSVELPKDESLTKIPELLRDERQLPEGILRAALAVEDWGSMSSRSLCEHVRHFVQGVKGNYKRETSPGVWELAPPKKPLDLRKMTGVEAYVQWYMQGKLAFGDTDFDEDEIRLSLRADGAENPFATPSLQVTSLLVDLVSESEFLIRSREKWWDVAVLTLVVRDPDLALTHLAIESSLPQTSDHLFGGLDDARDELDQDAQVVAALWNLAARAVEYIRNPLNFSNDGAINEEHDPTIPADSLGVFMTLCNELREQAEKVVASTTLEETSSQKSGSAQKIEVPSYERERGVEGLDDRVESLRGLASTISNLAPTDARRSDLDLKIGAAISSAEGLRKAVRFARTSSDVEVIKSLDALGLATLNLQPALKNWRTHFLLGPKELAAGKSQTSHSTNPPTASSSPRFARPVHVCRAAEVLNVRASSVLRKLRRSRRKIDDDAVPKTCEFEDLVATYPERQRRLRTWADENYPVD